MDLHNAYNVAEGWSRLWRISEVRAHPVTNQSVSAFHVIMINIAEHTTLHIRTWLVTKVTCHAGMS